MSLDVTTARLTLRPLTRAEVTTAHALWTDSAVRQYLWNDEAVTPDRVREVIDASTRDFATRRYGLWGVYDTATGEFAGFAGCREWPEGGPELMYGLAPAWWGRGLATEAADAVLAHLFETLGYPHVMAATDPPNLASVQVMERLGMTCDWRGEMHGLDTLVYRLSRERWRRLRSAASLSGCRGVECAMAPSLNRSPPRRTPTRLSTTMAKARRTTHRSSAGKKLYAVRSADGQFKDIQTYERAHRADLARGSKAEVATAAKAATKAAKKAKKTAVKKTAKKAAKKVVTKAVKKTAKKR